MLRVLLVFLVLAYVPGAIVFRAPTRGRSARAALPAEERLFWAVVLSLAMSSGSALALAALGWYSLTHVIVADLMASAVVALWSRGDLKLPAGAPRPGLSALPPIVLLGLALWLYTPPGELLLGGKDPGVYVNEGVQIAQRGSLVIRDPVVASVPPDARDLFFPWRGDPTYYGLRFMGFFVLDPTSGTVVAQFPHLYPVWIAFGYGAAGLPGALAAVTACALAGLAAVYFAAAWLFGRTVAVAGVGLLAVNVAEVWFGRYSNSELGFQALTFAALLAWGRAAEGRGRLFALVAASLVGLALFVRLDAVLLVGALVATALLAGSGRRVWPAAFAPALALSVAAAWVYYTVVMRPYAAQLVGFLANLPRGLVVSSAGAAAAAGALVWLGRRRWQGRRWNAWMPGLLAALVLGQAAYAYFFRRAGGRLAVHDADALRTFAAYYVGPWGLAAALTGFALTIRRLFWRSPAFFLTLAVFALFFFYKVRIVPEHFWMARRFLPVILPGALLLVAAAAFWPLVGGQMVSRESKWRRALGWAWVTAGALVVVAFGWRFWQQSAPVRAHVEYRGATRHLERLDERFTDRDLIIVESRQASDLHVLGLPLAYAFGRNVLVLDSRQPDKARLAGFLAWAWTRYSNVYFLGGGGTDLIDPRLAVQPIVGERFQIPEYHSPLNAYPSGPRFKEFDFALYRFVAPGERPSEVTLDIGTTDDVYVVRFHAKERHIRGATFRWSRDESYISVLPPARATTITLWLSNGGRPRNGAPPARMELYVDDRPLGSATVDDGFRPYRFEVPADLSAAWAAAFRTVRLKLVSTTWNPRRLLGVPDDRDLGVMVDRVEIR